MRQIPHFMSIVGIALVVGVALSAPSRSTAQDATPEDATGLTEGVTIEALALGEVATLPQTPATVVLSRFQLAPGATQTTPASDPSLALIYQESGTGTVRLKAPVTVMRGGTGTPGTQEEIPADTDFALEPGDSFFWLPNVEGMVRNERTEPATALVVIIYPPHDATATP